MSKDQSYWISELKLSEIIRNQYLYSFLSVFFFFFLDGLITLNRLIFHKYDSRISIKLIRNPAIKFFTWNEIPAGIIKFPLQKKKKNKQTFEKYFI